jgi:hypothetical protein
MQQLYFLSLNSIKERKLYQHYQLYYILFYQTITINDF